MEIRDELEDALDFTQDAIEKSVFRLYDEARIQKTAERRYKAIESRDKLRRFAISMKSAKRMFKHYGDGNADTDEGIIE